MTIFRLWDAWKNGMEKVVSQTVEGALEVVGVFKIGWKRLKSEEDTVVPLRW